MQQERESVPPCPTNQTKPSHLPPWKAVYHVINKVKPVCKSQGTNNKCPPPFLLLPFSQLLGVDLSRRRLSPSSSPKCCSFKVAAMLPEMKPPNGRQGQRLPRPRQPSQRKKKQISPGIGTNGLIIEDACLLGGGKITPKQTVCVCVCGVWCGAGRCR